MPDQLPNYIGDGGRGVEAVPVHAPTLSLAKNGYPITPSSAVLDPPVKAVHVNQACTITMVGADGTSLAITMDGAGVPPMIPIKVTAISTGTVVGLHDEEEAIT